jgi:hypothetical protein
MKLYTLINKENKIIRFYKSYIWNEYDDITIYKLIKDMNDDDDIWVTDNIQNIYDLIDGKFDYTINRPYPVLINFKDYKIIEFDI